MFKIKVLIDLYLKNINILFYGVFSLVKSFLYLLYIVVIDLFQCNGEGWLGYVKGVGLVATLIRLFTWELLQVYIRGLWIVTKFIKVFTWELF